jgi:hypothetical protein
MLNMTIIIEPYSIKIVDGLMTETYLDGVLTLDSNIRNKAYDLMHETYKMKQARFRGFYRYYGLITRDVK